MASTGQVGTAEPLTEWMDLRSLTRYASVSERTLRDWLHRGLNPLPATRVGSKILVRRSVFDRWLESHPYRSAESVDVDAVVKDILTQLGGKN